jgi:hypothetical protein
MNDRGTSLIVLFLGAPHALEGAEGGQDRTSDPDRVLALRRCDDLDLSGLWEISLNNQEMMEKERTFMLAGA